MTVKKSVHLNRVTLKAVVTRIKDIGTKDYHDKVYENILPIFNKLTTLEKRTLLRGLINICFIVEDRVIVDNKALEDVKLSVEEAKKTIKADMTSVEEFNQKELVKLKTWIVKIVSLIILLTIGAVIIIMTLTGSDIASLGWLQNVGKILGTVFGG